MKEPDAMKRGAVLSRGGAFRFRLTRRWGRTPAVVFVMLNPSTADAATDDPTIRRCIGFARAWGFGGLVVVNLFPWRATNPRDLADSAKVRDVVCRTERDRHIRSVIAGSSAPPVAAWGAHPMAKVEQDSVIALSSRWDCLGLTKGGAPKHPLYLRSTTRRTRWK